MDLAHLARLALDLVGQHMAHAGGRGHAAAASSDCWGVAISAPHGLQSAHRRAWAFPARRLAARAHGSGTPMLVAARMASASAQVLASGTVGPLAITEGSSPGTSLMVSVTTRAGAQAAPGARP
jgi:hypothetical protein